jgi:hypothetical protein
VTGCQMANFTGLAAARHRMLRNAGWDVEADGLFGAPPIDVVVNDEAHYTIFMALRLLGLGANRVRRIPTDEQGRMRADDLDAALRGRQGPCIVCPQAGNVNTGAIDPLCKIAQSAKERGAWLHVDGAFASPPGLHGTSFENLPKWIAKSYLWLLYLLSLRFVSSRKPRFNILNSIAWSPDISQSICSQFEFSGYCLS